MDSLTKSSCIHRVSILNQRCKWHDDRSILFRRWRETRKEKALWPVGSDRGQGRDDLCLFGRQTDRRVLDRTSPAGPNDELHGDGHAWKPTRADEFTWRGRLKARLSTVRRRDPSWRRQPHGKSKIRRRRGPPEIHRLPKRRRNRPRLRRGKDVRE